MSYRKSSKKSEVKPSYVKLLLGFAVILLGLLILFNKDQGAEILSESFASEPVKVEGFLLNTNKVGNAPERIVIPSLSIDLRIKESTVRNGYWEVFHDSAGWGQGSGFPGAKGNQVIFAHAKEELFLPLRSIKSNAKIYLFAESNYYEYFVTEIKEVSPNEISVIKPTEDETLTLYTCSGFADSQRLIVIAKRISSQTDFVLN